MLSQKDEILTVCRKALDEAFDTTELDKAATRLQDQALGMAARVRQLVEENARVQRDQDEFKEDYETLLAGHAKLSEKIRAIAEQKRTRQNVGGASSYSSTCWKNRKSALALNRGRSWHWWIRWSSSTTETWSSASETG